MASRQRPGGELRERFYRSVAETLTLLHTAPGYDRRAAMAAVARTLASAMGLPLVWIGRREPARSDVEVLAAAGPAADYASSLRLSADEREPGGRGPVAIVLRRQKARVTSVDAPEFGPWREAAMQYGFGSCIAAAATTPDGGQLTLVAYALDKTLAAHEQLLDWAQRLADELARFWEHQGLLERDLRMSRYRDAQRMIQRALLEQPDPDGVFRTLAQALVDVAGAAAVDVYAADGQDGMLRRVALAGPLAGALRALPTPPRHAEGPAVLTPTLAFMRGAPVVRTLPASHDEMSPIWRTGPLLQMGAVGCWPLPAKRSGDASPLAAPFGVFVVVTVEPDAFDADMCALLDEIADATGLALVQHQQRDALRTEQQRQTYLALHDALTGLPNRRALDRHLDGVLADAERDGKRVAVGLLDLDDLKPINDHHGHAAGDRILAEVARRLRDALRQGDYVARLGGDEFVLVFEDIECEENLDLLLDRIWLALQQPIRVGGAHLELSASLGIALFPSHATASGEQLLRRADQAMYQAKAHKHRRVRWWSLPAPEDPAVPFDHDERPLTPYGTLAADLLTPRQAVLASRLPALVEAFYAELLTHAGAARLLGALPPEDVEATKRRLSHLLAGLLDPHLDSVDHCCRATRAGFFFAACGVEEVWLLEAIERLRDLLVVALAAGAHLDRRPLDIVLQRLSLEGQWQLESMRELQRRRVALLARLNALAWSAEGYLELIQGVVDILVAHQEVTACAVGRPDGQGRLTYEAVAGIAFENYLRELARGEAAPIRVEATSGEGAGPSGRAWRSGDIHRCLHYGSDPAMAPWRDTGLRLGIVSSVAIPLCPVPHAPAAILTLYSAHAGGFQSDDQQAFAEQIKTVLDLALVRVAPPRPGAALLPFFVRERWRGMVATAALEMHYQPLIRLADAAVVELEALARLREADGTLLMPAAFLPALGDDDLLALFGQALSQATAFRHRLQLANHTLAMSVNAPAEALGDARYAATAAAVLAGSHCPPGAILLEILESPMNTEHSAQAAVAGMQVFKALGFRLVEDDLGAGYSSLIRLRNWPFDRVKIDQAIVTQVADDPLRTLRFIRQLIRLGHDLGLEVVVEGLETAGLIEAALILGADLGQGYALARPMPPAAIPGWLDGFHGGWDRARPQTALGALAGVLVWEEQFGALPAEPAFWQRHAQTGCALADYFHQRERTFPELLRSHAGMLAAAAGGPRHQAYRAARAQMVALLTGHVRREERPDPPGDPVGPALAQVD